jgi:hypothetical protein
VALNVSDTDQRVAVPVPRAGELVDALGDGWARASADTLELLVPARWGAVWVGPG